MREAFGFSFESDVPPSVKLALQSAADNIGSVRKKMAASLWDSWAEHAVAADSLKFSIDKSIRQQLTDAYGTVQALQQPIAVDMVGQLGSAYEASLPLGVSMNRPGEVSPPPPCVQIRSAGLQGDLTPALDCYRALAFPQRFTRGPDYQATLDFINNSLPENQALREQFASAVLQLQNLPDTVLQELPPPVNPSVPPGGMQTQFPNAAVVSATIAPSALTPPGGLPRMPLTCEQAQAAGWGAAIGQMPSGRYYAPGYPPGSYFEVGWSSPDANNCRTLSVVLNGAPPGIGPPPSFCLVCPTQGLVPGVPVGPQPPSGPPPMAGGGPPAAPPATPPPGRIVEVPGGLPRPYYPPEQPPPYTSPGYVPEFPPYVSPPTPPASCPEPPPPPCTYDLVCSSDKILYIVKHGSRLNSVFDAVIATGDPAGWDLRAYGDQCAGPQQKKTPEQPPPANFPVGALGIKACEEFGSVPGVELPDGLGDMSKLIGLRNADGSLNISWAGGDGLGVTAAVARTVAGFFATIVDSIAKVASSVVSQSGCASGQNLALVGTSITLNLLRNFIGDSLDQFRVPNQQQRNFLCPTALPSADQAARAWLGNTIDAATLECWVRACGTRFPEFMRYVDANRTKLASLQYGTLRMRDKISQPLYEQRIRELGFTLPTDAQDVLDLLQQIPPPSDLVRMMVRDAADENLVRKFRLDDQFTDKFTGKVEEWTRQQGIDPTYMRFLWRSHWSIPAPGQLMEMLHRLSRLNPGDAAFVDRDTIKAALVQQDIAPFWVDKYLAISYRPLNRIDTRRAFEVGALNDQSLTEAYLNLGYNQQDADTLVRYNRIATTLKYARSPAVTQHAKGELTDAQLDDTLKSQGATPEAIQFAHLQSRTTMDRLRRQRCLTAYRRRLLLGDNDSVQTADALRSLGLSDEQSRSLLAGWECEKIARGKAIPAGELCGLYEQGAITLPDLTSRLQKLGYEFDDAILLARRCAQRVADKITKEEAKLLRQQEREAERAQSKLARAARQSAADAQKAARNAERMRRVALAQTQRIQEAANNFSKYAAVSLPDAVNVVNGTIAAMMEQTLLTRDEIIQAILLASRNPQSDSAAALLTNVQAQVVA